MHEKMSYRILSLGLKLGLGIAICAGASSAQHIPTAPSDADLYCSGVATDKAIPNDT